MDVIFKNGAKIGSLSLTQTAVSKKCNIVLLFFLNHYEYLYSKQSYKVITSSSFINFNSLNKERVRKNDYTTELGKHMKNLGNSKKALWGQMLDINDRGSTP